MKERGGKRNVAAVGMEREKRRYKGRGTSDRSGWTGKR